MKASQPGADGRDAREASPGLAKRVRGRAASRCLQEQDSHPAIIFPVFSQFLLVLEDVLRALRRRMHAARRLRHRTISIASARERAMDFSRSLEGNLIARDFGNISGPSRVW